MNEPKKILIAEDETMIRRALMDQLSLEGFKVIPAKNGKEALTLAALHSPNMILLDIVMPEMDGITASSKLMEDSKTKDIPVMFLTNLTDSQEVRDMITRENYDFLVKSNWDISDVVTKIKERLG